MKYSIGIPAFKAIYLEENIKAILEQTFEDFELIIVNDASPDNIRDIVSSFSDCRIKYFENKENVGAERVVENWNICLSKASGEYFVLMGDDDLLEPNFLETYNQLIDKYPNLGVYHCLTKIIDSNNNFISLTEMRPEFEGVYSLIWHRIKRLRKQYISDFLYNTQWLKANGGFFYTPLAWGADDIAAYIGASISGIANINIPIFNYRNNPYTISSTGNVYLKLNAVQKEIEWLKSFIEYTKSLDEVEEAYKKQITNFLPNYKIKRYVDILTEYFRKNRFYRLSNVLLNHSHHIKIKYIIYSFILSYK